MFKSSLSFLICAELQLTSIQPSVSLRFLVALEMYLCASTTVHGMYVVDVSSFLLQQVSYNKQKPWGSRHCFFHADNSVKSHAKTTTRNPEKISGPRLFVCEALQMWPDESNGNSSWSFRIKCCRNNNGTNCLYESKERASGVFWATQICSFFFTLKRFVFNLFFFCQDSKMMAFCFFFLPKICTIYIGSEAVEPPPLPWEIQSVMRPHILQHSKANSNQTRGLLADDDSFKAPTYSY